MQAVFCQRLIESSHRLKRKENDHDANEGKIVAITGAASGMGRAIAQGLAAGGEQTGGRWARSPRWRAVLAFTGPSGKIRGMKLLPQFSIRLMLGVTALAAGLFSIVGLAVRGHGWAIGISMGLASLVIMLGTGAGLFGVLWVFSLVSPRSGGRRIAAAAGGPPAACPFAPSAPQSPFAGSPIDAVVIDAEPAAAPPGATVEGDPTPGGSP